MVHRHGIHYAPRIRSVAFSDVGGEGFKEETLTCEDDVSDVGNVGFSKGTQNHQQIVATKWAKPSSQEHKKYMITIQIQTTLISFPPNPL